jgi:hypothetical protein
MYSRSMRKKISHQGVARVAKYANSAKENGDNLADALNRGRRLEMAGRLSDVGELKPTHPDDADLTSA